MRTRSFSLLLALALVLGAGVLWLTRGSRGAAGDAVPAPPRRAAAPRPPAAEPLEPARLPGAPADGEERAEDARQALAPARDAAPPATASGTERTAIVGRVLGPDGAPMARARVLVGEPASWSRAALDAAGDAYETATGPDGRFAVTGPEAGLFRLAVRAPGHAPLDLENLPLPAGAAEQDVGDLVLSRGLILGGVVIDADGAPVDGARLLRWEEADLMAAVLSGEELPGAVLAKSGPDGRFRVDVLAPGAWTLLVTHPDHPDRLVEGADFEVGRLREDLVVRLERGLSIAGRIAPSAEAARDVSGLVVRATPVEGGRALSGAERERQGPPAWREATTDERGLWEVGGLLPGRYLLRVRRPAARAWMRDWIGEPVEAQAGEAGVVLTLLPASGLVVRVVDAETRAPLDGLSLTVESEGPSWSTSVDLPAPLVRTDRESGVTRVADLMVRAGTGTVAVFVHREGYASARTADLAYSPGEPLDAGVIELAPLEAVLVRVVDGTTGRGLGGARVRLHELEGGGELADSIRSTLSSSERWGRADAEGLARMPAVEEGTLWVTASAEGYQTSAPVALAPGTEPRVVALGRGGRVTVLAVDGLGAPVPGARVEARHRPALGGRESESETTRSATCDAAGRAVLENLECGLHVLRVVDEEEGLFHRFGGDAAAGADGVEVVVDEGTDATVHLVVPARGELLGTVRESGSPLVGARLWLAPAGEAQELVYLLPGLLPEAVTDGEGRFAFQPLRVGAYRLTVEHSTRAMPAVLEVELREGKNGRAVRLYSSAVEGRVVDERGEPVAGARVTVDTTESGLSRMVKVSISVADEDDLVFEDGRQAWVRTDADGRYRLHGVMPNVELVVTVAGPWIRTASSPPFRVRPDETETGVDLRVERAGAVLVRVRSVAGEPGDWEVVARRGEALEWEEASGASVELTGLEPGTWTVELERAGERLAQEVVVVAGETAEAVFEVP